MCQAGGSKQQPGARRCIKRGASGEYKEQSTECKDHNNEKKLESGQSDLKQGNI